MAKSPSMTSSSSEDDSTDTANIRTQGKGKAKVKESKNVAEEEIVSDEVESDSDEEVEADEEEDGEKQVDDMSETETDPKPINVFIQEPKEKKPLIVRIFNDDSVLALLEGMNDYLKQNGVEHFVANKDVFYDFIKDKLLPMETTTRQLKEKIRKLRIKFLANLAKKTIFAKPYDKKVFELSDKIWGNGSHLAIDNVEMSGDTKTRKSKRVTSRVVEKTSERTVKKAKKLDFEKSSLDWDLYPRLKQSLESQNLWLGVNYEAITHEKAKELEDKWKFYQGEEAKLNMKRLDLLKEQTSLFYNELMKD